MDSGDFKQLVIPCSEFLLHNFLFKQQPSIIGSTDTLILATSHPIAWIAYFRLAILENLESTSTFLSEYQNIKILLSHAVRLGHC